MKPWEAEAFEWDDGNESELARHRIVPQEVEEVFEMGPVWVPNRKHRAGDWKMVGTTVAGRTLTVVVRWQEDRLVLRPITGWESTRGETTRYVRD